MAGNKSLEAFNRVLAARYQQFRKSLDSWVSAVATTHKKDQAAHAKELAKDITALFELLNAADRPHWLESLHQPAKDYASTEDAQYALAFLRRVMKFYSQISEIVISDRPAPLFDFDKLYIRFRDAGKLPELFDELIRMVEDIIRCNHVDSSTALDALREIVELLRASKDGSFLAVKQTFSVVRFLRNLLDESLKNVPIWREVRAAYDRTLDDAEDELAAVEQSMRDAALKSIEASLPKLQMFTEYREESIVFLNLDGRTKRVDGPDSSSPENDEVRRLPG